MEICLDKSEHVKHQWKALKKQFIFKYEKKTYDNDNLIGSINRPTLLKLSQHNLVLVSFVILSLFISCDIMLDRNWWDGKCV